jgi:hypothetical protein
MFLKEAGVFPAFLLHGRVFEKKLERLRVAFISRRGLTLPLRPRISHPKKQHMSLSFQARPFNEIKPFGA